MNIVKQIKPNMCAAMRCKEGQHVLVDGESLGRPGMQVPLCQRHEAELSSNGMQVATNNSVATTIPEVQGAALAVVPMTNEIQQELMVEQVSAEEAAREIEHGLAIQTDEDLAFAAEVLSEVKGHWNRLEVKKKEATDPLNQALKAIREWFKPAQSYYARAEIVLKQKIASFHQQRQEERQAALLTAQAAFASQNTEAMSTAIAALPPPPPKIDNLSTREDWSYEVVDFSILPDKFKVPNHALLVEMAKAARDKLAIPGVRPVSKTIVISRAS